MENNDAEERTVDLGSLRRRIGDLRRAIDRNSGSGRTALDIAAAASARNRWARQSLARGTRSHLHQHRLWRRTEDDSIGTVQEAVDRLNEATSDLSSILDESLPQLLSSDDFMNLVPDTESMERRHKQRKLDGDALDREPPPKYGWYGQVVPGRLKMSILSCDGGYHTERDEECIHRHYTPENILPNDKSVYCTEKDRCDIILKHWKETPFSLTKIVIKTPDAGFTAPLQEGLIFVSMTTDNLISGTSHYQIVGASAPPAPQRTAGPYALSRNPYTASSSLPRINSRPTEADARPPSRRRRQASNAPSTLASQSTSTISTFPIPSWTDRDQHDDVLFLNDEPAGVRSQPIRAPSSEFKITASCDDPSGDEEDETSPAVMLDRQRRRHLGLELISSDEDNDPSPARGRQLRSTPREIKAVTHPQDGMDPPPTLLQPHASFFIERKRNVVTVKFDPPV